MSNAKRSHPAGDIFGSQDAETHEKRPPVQYDPRQMCHSRSCPPTNKPSTLQSFLVNSVTEYIPLVGIVRSFNVAEPPDPGHDDRGGLLHAMRLKASLMTFGHVTWSFNGYHTLDETYRISHWSAINHGSHCRGSALALKRLRLQNSEPSTISVQTTSNPLMPFASQPTKTHLYVYSLLSGARPTKRSSTH